MHLESPTTAQLGLIPSGPQGILETLRVMKRLMRDGKKNMTVRERALFLIHPCDQKDYACEVRRLHAFVRDDIRYVQDIHEVETVQSADKTLEYMAGDCDDKSVLLASMLESTGHPSRFVAIGFAPEIYEHVYVETKIGPHWIPLESTEPVDAGWEPEPRLVRARMVY